MQPTVHLVGPNRLGATINQIRSEQSLNLQGCRRFGSIEVLRAEHQIVLQGLALVERQLGLLDGSGRPPRKIMRMVELRVSFVAKLLQLHIRKEQDALFPVLSKRLGRDRGLIAAVDAEHDDVRALLARVSRYFQEPGSFDSPVELLQNARRLSGLVERHISKEDNVLFWITELRLHNDDEERISHRIGRMDQVAAAHARHGDTYRTQA